MANNNSQIKRNRQNEKRRLKNRMVKSSIRTAHKSVIKAIESKDSGVEELYNKYVKIVDTAAGKGIVHKRTAARKKSRLAQKVNAIQQQA